MTRGRRALAAGAAAGALIAAATASAHTEVVATTPADGAALDRAPRVVRVVYGAPLAAPGRATAVTSGGTDLARPARLDPRDARALIIPVRPGAGTVRVAWTATAGDAHELSGRLSYTVREASAWAEVPRLGAALVAAAARVAAAVGPPPR